MDIKSPDISAAGFTLTTWYGTAGGAALSADASDPNTSAPAASRIHRVAGRRGSLITHGNGTVRGVAIGGTSIVLQGWWYDESIATWLKLVATTTTFTTATGLTQVLTIGNMAGAKIFFQVTSNTGVTAIGYDVI